VNWLDKTQPLWLPAGSVRALLAIFIVIVGFLALILAGGDVETLVTLVLGFYFISKAAAKPGTGGPSHRDADNPAVDG